MKLGVGVIVLFISVVAVLSLFAWSARQEVLLSSAAGDPVKNCTGQPDGTACVLKASSSGSISAEAIAIGVGDANTGVCKDGKCVPKEFKCPDNSFECKASTSKICCPGTKDKDYSCDSVSGEPYCKPKNQATCDKQGKGWTRCTCLVCLNVLCCPPGTTCTTTHGLGAICSNKKDDCPAEKKCDDYCCSDKQTCITVDAPVIGAYKVCSANSCDAGKVLCPSKEPAPAPGKLPKYPSLCCPTGTCMNSPDSGRPFCSDGNPGMS